MIISSHDYVDRNVLLEVVRQMLTPKFGTDNKFAGYKTKPVKKDSSPTKFSTK